MTDCSSRGGVVACETNSCGSIVVNDRDDAVDEAASLVSNSSKQRERGE